MSMIITSLLENAKSGEMFLCEPGLSLLIEWRDKKFLLDTGASEFFRDNADTLGKDLTRVDYVILSHGHSDHSGGIRTLCASTRRKFKLVMSPRFFEKKFIREKDYLRYIGNDFNEEYLQIENVATVFPLTDTFTLMEEVYILSGFPSITEYEDEPNNFLVLGGGGYSPDGFADEQVLVFNLPQGLVVVSGCTHRGIVNICETVKERLRRPVYAIVGGMHLKDSDDSRIGQTAEYIRKEGITHLALGHCTGAKALACLAESAPMVHSLSSGAVILFED